MRLDERSGRALRIELDRLLKLPKFNGDQAKLASAVGMSVAGLTNILKKHSNGSLESARKIASISNKPLAELVGGALAQVAEERHAESKKSKANLSVVPRAQPAQVIPRHEGINGIKVGDVLFREPLSTTELEDLRKGRVNVAALTKLVDDYVDLLKVNDRMKTYILATVLKLG